MTVDEDYVDFPIVWLKEYRTFGHLIHIGAYAASIKFVWDGETVVEDIMNEDWEYEPHTDYESE